MNLKKRLSREVGLVGLIFVFLFMVVSVIFLQFSSAVNDVIVQSEPAIDGLDRMLIDVYENHIFLLEYLQSSTYAESLAVSAKRDGEQLSSQSFENNLRKAIQTEIVTDEDLIENYRNAIGLYEQLEAFRGQLIALHEKEIVSNTYASSQKRELLAEYSTLLAKATDEFQTQIDELEGQNQDAKDRLIGQSQMYAVILIILLFICVGTIVYTVRKFSTQLIGPLDTTIDATKQFVQGDYETQVETKTSITELRDLQDNINAVFRAISKVAKSDDTGRKTIQKNLLKKEYVEILEFLEQKQEQGQKATITDVKKFLQITHPTVLSRLKYLEGQEYIRIEKDGREKYILLE